MPHVHSPNLQSNTENHFFNINDGLYANEIVDGQDKPQHFHARVANTNF